MGIFMIFVGRKNEAKTIIKELQQGKNVIIRGKFGIGRTFLVNKIAEQLGEQRQFIFVDFGQTPGKMSKKLMKELHISSRLKKTGKKMGYRSMRYRISNFESSKRKQTIIVFDNVAKLTNQKIIFLRHIILENHFQFIAIVENFLSTHDLSCLKALLLPANVLSIRYLKKDDIVSFIRLYSDKHNLNWSDAYIHNLATLVNGHPLGMIEMVKNIKRGNI
jgi:hypothetical protein